MHTCSHRRQGRGPRLEPSFLRFRLWFRTTLMDPLQEDCQGGANRIRKGRKVMTDRRFWILLAGILLMSAAFLLLDFRVAPGIPRSVQTIMVTELQGNYPDRLQPDDNISMVMVGEGPLARALQKALTEEIEKVGTSQVKWEQELSPNYPDPVLVVKMGQISSTWTPFFATSQFSVQAAYATDGDTTFMDSLDTTQPYIRNPDPSAVNLYTEYEVTDRSFGLISRPGYDRYLAEYLAREIVQALKNLYNIQDQGGGPSQ